jgi:hypothetical protein
LLNKIKKKLKQKRNEIKAFLYIHRRTKIAMHLLLITVLIIVIIFLLPDIASYPVGWGVP